MARILYGVQTDLGGHLVRSRVIAQNLKGHEVLFAGGERISSIRRFGFDTTTIPLLGTVMRNGRLAPLATAMDTVRVLSQSHAVLGQLSSVIQDFKPDLVITDYEYFVPIAARRAGLPCVSIDRQHFVTNCVYPLPEGGQIGRNLLKASMYATRMKASRYFVISFLEAQARNPQLTEIFPPVIRPEILALTPKQNDYALAYLHSSPIDWIRKHLSGRKRQFIIYGHDLEFEEGNLRFRKHDPDRFAHDLAGALFVMSHAGHNLISECLHLRKPLLCFPGPGLYEQYLNAFLLEREGLGIHATRYGTDAALDMMETRLDHMSAKLQEWKPWTHQAVTNRLSELLNKSYNIT